MYKYIFETIFELEDDKKHAERDLQHVYMLIRKNEKAPIPLTRKKRKGQVLKAIARDINPALKQFYNFKAIRYAIVEINLKAIDFEAWRLGYEINYPLKIEAGC